MNKTIIIISLLFCSISLMAQHHETSNEVHHEKKKEGGITELITSGIYSFMLEHDEGNPGIEVHLTYWFTHRWGGGASYTIKFEEEESVSDIALLASWNPTRWLTINAGPNFALGTDHREFELGAYAESEINIRPTHWFHFGPLVGTVISDNSELTVGLHLGFEF